MFAKTCLGKLDLAEDFLHLISEIWLMYQILKLLPVFFFKFITATLYFMYAITNK